MTAAPAWLQSLVEREIAAYGLPAPSVTPDIWPESRGRGVLLSEPDKRPMSNASTIRFMRPGCLAYPEGYMRYTDEAGDYVNPRTGETGSLTSAEDDEGPLLTARQQRPQAARWWWPGDAIPNEGDDDLLQHVVGKTVVDVQSDGVRVRLVLDRGDRPEPRLYADLWRLAQTAGDRPALEPWAADRAIVGTSIAAAATEADTLGLRLSDGTELTCAAERCFEAWQIVVEGRGLLICLPGGGIATFHFDGIPTWAGTS